MPKKRSYHTIFKIKYRLGLLMESETKLAPASTLRYWDDIDFSAMIGFNSEDPLMKSIDFHKVFITKTSLVKIAKCLWWIYSTYNGLLEKMRGWKKNCINISSRLFNVSSISLLHWDMNAHAGC